MDLFRHFSITKKNSRDRGVHQRAGLARARANGKVLGRRRIGQETEDAIRHALKANGVRKVAAMVGCGVGTVQRIRAREGV